MQRNRKQAGDRFGSALFRGTAMAVLAGAVAACSYEGGTDDGSVAGLFQRKVSWFSYLEGEDIRNRCDAGHLEYRFVYNGQYNEQVRSYEIVGTVGQTAQMTSRVRGNGGYGLSLDLSNPLEPYQWEQQDADLSLTELVQLNDALSRDNAGQVSTEGNYLVSDDFYWVSALCYDGAFVVNAWPRQDSRFEGLKFAEFLKERDSLEPEFREARDIGSETFRRSREERSERHSHFSLKVGEDGLY
ncbi:hypothetical protein [Kiloniella sp. b19]|uniref:hypothetical protein n=1 Tax=Kiloniella sp. GXU_MW_B19 TaxID=3141326 RepID=UPI0031E34583